MNQSINQSINQSSKQASKQSILNHHHHHHHHQQHHHHQHHHHHQEFKLEIIMHSNKTSNCAALKLQWFQSCSSGFWMAWGLMLQKSSKHQWTQLIWCKYHQIYHPLQPFLLVSTNALISEPSTLTWISIPFQSHVYGAPILIAS